MKLWARLDGAVVAEIVKLPDELTPGVDIFHSDLVFVATNGTAKVGDVHADGAFTTPPAPVASLAALIAYAEAKQMAVLAALKVVYIPPDDGAPLDTMCDERSITFLNSLASWVALNAAASPPPTRVYYNLDGAPNELTPAQMALFLELVGAHVQSAFDALATVRAAITGAVPTIASTADIDAAAWPVSIG